MKPRTTPQNKMPKIGEMVYYYREGVDKPLPAIVTDVRDSTPGGAGLDGTRKPNYQATLYVLDAEPRHTYWSDKGEKNGQWGFRYPERVYKTS